jgi:hypothetical protein
VPTILGAVAGDLSGRDADELLVRFGVGRDVASNVSTTDL